MNLSSVRSLSTKGGLGLLVLSCGLFSVAPAKASLVVVLSPTSSGNTFIYDVNFLNTMDASGAPSERLDAPGTGITAFATIYDLFGVTSVSLAAGSPFTFTTQNIGNTPAGTLPTDSPSLINITLTYTGPTTTTAFSSPSLVVVTSTSTQRGFANYTGQDTKNAGTAAGSQAANIGSVTVPVAATVPEPAAMFLLGGGLLGLGAFGRRKFNL